MCGCDRHISWAPHPLSDEIAPEHVPLCCSCGNAWLSSSVNMSEVTDEETRGEEPPTPSLVYLFIFFLTRLKKKAAPEKSRTVDEFWLKWATQNAPPPPQILEWFMTILRVIHPPTCFSFHLQVTPVINIHAGALIRPVMVADNSCWGWDEFAPLLCTWHPPIISDRCLARAHAR